MTKVTKFYNEIWKEFAREQFDEATARLLKRWTINRIPLSLLEGKAVLDMGCGSGRYSYALLRLGAKKVIGVDIHKPPLKIPGFSFRKGNVLRLPCKDNEFDFVFCNGVLHHTVDWKRGIREAYRVLKPRGVLWLYMLKKSKYWDAIDKIRRKLTKEDRDIFYKHLVLVGWKPNKIFLLLDTFFVPHRTYHTKREMEQVLREYGFKSIRCLDRHIDELGRRQNIRFLARK